MKKIIAALAIGSAFMMLGCAADPAAPEASVESTKLPLITHDKSNSPLFFGVYDDATHIIRLSSKFLGYVRSQSVSSPSLIAGGASFALDAADHTTVNQDLSIGDTVEVFAPVEGGHSMHWELKIATPDTAAEAATQTDFPMSCDQI